MMSPWFYRCIFFSIIVQIDCKTHRVCYTTSVSNRFTNCTKHTLQCGGDKTIQVFSAQYGYLNRTEYSSCQCGRDMTACDRCSNHSTTEENVKKCFRPYSDTDYWRLVSECSFKKNCSAPLPAIRNTTCSAVSKFELRPSFSHVKYACLAEKTVVNFCNGTRTENSLSILYERSSGANRCTCTVTGDGQRTDINNYTITSLDIRNSSFRDGGCFNLSLTSGNRSESIVSKTVSQNRKIFEALRNQTTVIRLALEDESVSPEILWIQIQGHNADVTVTCETEHKEESSFGVQVALIVSSITGSLALVSAIVIGLVIYCKKSNKPSETSEASNERYVDSLYSEIENNAVHTVPDGTSKEAIVLYKKEGIRVSHNKSPNCTNKTAPANEGYDQGNIAANTASSDVMSANIYHTTVNADGDCYNHLTNMKPQRTGLNTDYDTMASASRDVKKLNKKDDYYSYDHLGTSTGTTLADNDYDTTRPRETDT